MGYGDAPYVVIQHRDGARDHVHILTSRVDVRGNVVSDWKCKERAEGVLREIEKGHGLERVTPSRDVLRAAPSRGEFERFNRTGELSAKMALQGHVETPLRESPTATEFIERLQLSGVEAIPYVQKSGRVTGISFRKGKELMKDSDLGRGFSWNALQERGLSYDEQRDRPAVETARERLSLEREAPAAPAPERTFADLTNDLGKQVGQYLLDQANPLHRIESQVRTLEAAGRGIADGVSALRDLVTRRDEAKQLSRAAAPDTTGRDAIERLQQAAGIDPVKSEQDGLERLSNVPGLESKDSPADLTLTPDKTAPELTPALDPQRDLARKIANDAYTVRSAFVHGDRVKDEAGKLIIKRYKTFEGLLNAVLDQLRIVMVVLAVTKLSKEEFIKLIDDSFIDHRVLPKLEETLLPVKQLLIPDETETRSLDAMSS